MLRMDRIYKSLVRLGQPMLNVTISSVVVFAISVCAAQNTSAPTPAAIFRQARSSIVLIVGSASSDTVAQGSGFIVAKDKIVTNYHVIAGLSAAWVLFADGRTEPVAGVLAADADQDTAVLEVPTGTRHPLALGDELALHEGESVLAIGAPRGLELSLTNGIISAFRNSEKKFLIQNTAPIAPGSSGGPLLDTRGRVVGLTTSLLTDTPGVYFSIGIGAVKRLLKAAPTLSQSFADWAAGKGVTPSPNLGETFGWIKSKVEEKAGGTFLWQDMLPDPSQIGEERLYDLKLVQSSDECVWTLTSKMAVVAQGRSSSSFMGDSLVGCATTFEDDYSETLPIYYLKEAQLYTDRYGVPAVDLKFDGKKRATHKEGRWARTACRDASWNQSSTQHDPQDMVDDFLLIQFYRYRAEDNEDLAKRVASAFNHAAALCANRRPVSKEPF